MKQFHRRDFLVSMIAGGLALQGYSAEKKRLIEDIDVSVIWNGREGGTTWFHPRACMIPTQPNPVALMTCQSITGSDVFGQVHWSISKDLGKSWSQPEPIQSLARHPIDGGLEEGVCDVVPQYHAKTGVVLAIGHNVYYKNGVLTRPSEQRYPVYVIRSADGNWSERKKLEWNDPRAEAMYTCGCSQRIILGNGDILIPLSFMPYGRNDRSVTSVRCSFDGETLKILESGNELRLRVKRGLLEPSLVNYAGKYFVTIRAEDGHGYVSTSDDGLHWKEKRPWCWDDGEPLTMSTTQQHWMPHSNGLFLVYTRRAEHNVNVFRWRAPLYLAQVDPKKLCLIRESERVVFPLIGDGIDDPKHVARMGNFHVTTATPDQSWVTVGETLPHDDWRGNTLLGRITWVRKNELVL